MWGNGPAGSTRSILLCGSGNPFDHGRPQGLISPSDRANRRTRIARPFPRRRKVPPATETLVPPISSPSRRSSLSKETRKRVATVNPIELNPIEGFYRAHSNAVYAFLVSLCRDPVWAEDLMQDTFVKATRSMGGYRGGNPRSWLFSIARSVFIDDTRRRRPVPVEEIDDPATRDTDVTELMLIDRSLSRLPERQRTALLLTDLTGLSYAEVADVLGCSIAAVKVLIHRARMSFRAHYTETSQ